MAQQAWQDATVQLVELHKLQQVREASLAVIHAEVEAALLLALGDGHRGRGGRSGRDSRGSLLVRAEVPSACAGPKEREGGPRHTAGQGASRGGLVRRQGLLTGRMR